MVAIESTSENIALQKLHDEIGSFIWFIAQ